MPHPSDQIIADRIRAQRGRTVGYPARTRGLGAHSLAQSSAGRLVVETSRAGVDVDPATARHRREALAAEFERRDMQSAAAEARREADYQRREADRERDRAEQQRRETDTGPTAADRLLGSMAIGAGASVMVDGLSPSDDAQSFTAEAHAGQELTQVEEAQLEGGRVVGLSQADMKADLAEHGGQIAAVPTVATAPTTPAELVGRSGKKDPAADQFPSAALQTAPEVSVD